jgi:hypothetical protein
VLTKKTTVDTTNLIRADFCSFLDTTTPFPLKNSTFGTNFGHNDALLSNFPILKCKPPLTIPKRLKHAI